MLSSSNSPSKTNYSCTSSTHSK